MCVAIFQKAGAFVPKLGLANGFSINKDGAGFAYIDPELKKVVIKKGFMKFDPFATAYYEAVEKYGKDSPFLVHMRIKTAGAVSENNTHPFEVAGGAMIHNGSLFYPDKDYIGPDDDTRSDTRVFAEELKNILTFENVKRAEAAIRSAIGYHNKLVFLYDDGRYHIVNEQAGNWVDGIWYSNGSCRVYAGQQGGK